MLKYQRVHEVLKCTSERCLCPQHVSHRLDATWADAAEIWRRMVCQGSHEGMATTTHSCPYIYIYICMYIYIYICPSCRSISISINQNIYQIISDALNSLLILLNRWLMCLCEDGSAPCDCLCWAFGRMMTSVFRAIFAVDAVPLFASSDSPEMRELGAWSYATELCHRVVPHRASETVLRQTGRACHKMCHKS